MGRHAGVSHTIDKFNWGRIAVLGEERDRVLPGVNQLQLLVNCIVDKQRVLNLVNRFLVFFVEHTRNGVVVLEHLLLVEDIFFIFRRLGLRDFGHLSLLFLLSRLFAPRAERQAELRELLLRVELVQRVI